MLSIEQRKQINEKFSYLVNSGELLKTFSKDEVMKYYTGKGGLHGLEFKNFDCFHNYTKAIIFLCESIIFLRKVG